MAPSGEMTPVIKAPRLGTPRKLSLPSLRRWTAHATAEADSGRRASNFTGAARTPSSASGETNSSVSMHLPRFLRQGREDEYNSWMDLEWQQRQRLMQGQQQSATSPYACTHGPGDPLIRNRYVNVEPYEKNRVRLRVPEGGNDYINASPITLLEKRYISAQGPKNTSIPHFYRMLADETGSVAVVVMLTQTHEAGREKCSAYWPQQGSTIRLYADADSEDDGFEGEVSLLNTTEDTKAKCTIRHLKLRTRTKRKEAETQDPPWEEKEVKHLLFGGWPDFAVPEGDDRQALLELVRLSQRLNKASLPPTESSFPSSPTSSTSPTNLNPRIVHCSAGVGRSGTFIALDHLLTLLDGGTLDSVPDDANPIAETVDRLRQQRMMMVQSEAQLFFLYDVLREQWLARWQRRQT